MPSYLPKVPLGSNLRGQKIYVHGVYRKRHAIYDLNWELSFETIFYLSGSSLFIRKFTGKFETHVNLVHITKSTFFIGISSINVHILSNCESSVTTASRKFTKNNFPRYSRGKLELLPFSHRTSSLSCCVVPSLCALRITYIS